LTVDLAAVGGRDVGQNIAADQLELQPVAKATTPTIEPARMTSLAGENSRR
jgi:hypothetical protein